MRIMFRILQVLIAIGTFLGSFYVWKHALDYVDFPLARIICTMAVAGIGVRLASLFGRLAQGAPPAQWTDGRVGVGTITGWSRSGLKNGIRTYKISMNVESEDGSHFPGTLNVRIGRRRLGALRVGYYMPVIYQASHPQTLRTPQGDLAVSAQLLFDYIQQRDGIVDQATLDADYWGVPAQAEVTRVIQTGRVIHDRIQFELQLMVLPTDRSPFPSTAILYLSPYEQRLMQLTPRVNVKYLPHSPGRVIVQVPANHKSLSR